MTTATYTSVFDHSNDAGFRAWGLQFSNALTTAGLVATADTGQINWGTVTRPAVGVVGGYEIRRLPDSSLYFKIQYGTASVSATAPLIQVQVGTGSNGTGTLTGQLSSVLTAHTNTSFTASAAAFPTYISVTNNFFAFSFKVGLQGSFSGGLSTTAFFICGKTVDNTGAATTEGFSCIYLAANAPTLQTVRFGASPLTFTASNKFCVMPGDLTATTTLAGDIQAYHVWHPFPEMRPFPWSCVIKYTEVIPGNTFPATMVAAVSHTYLNAGSPGTSAPSLNSQNNWMLAMPYE